MNDLPFHILLFLVSGGVIVLLSAMFNSPGDREAIAALPRKYLWFVVGCTIVAGVMLMIGYTFASIR